ncbi:MAG: nucleotide pyrophosphohydrolase [Ruminococcus sp.]|nr:nucleotide pyrophosphohydrolase [Ruminococcus sp.]MCM1382212.1 hypothetical protein [Muribaculaceae bacterium]
MENFGFVEMQEIQKELQEKYKEQWGGLYPEKAVRMILWAFVELGEAADIMKKNGDGAILNDKEVRNHFIEELCDVMMYFNDVMLCYSITPQELKEVYLKKHEKNMSRW